MDTTQHRHTPSSISEQELFFPSSSQAYGQSQSQRQHEQQKAHDRWYDDLNNESPTVPVGSGVPAVNIIPATPTTVRSNSVRSQWSYKDPNEQKQMSGALPEVDEEDDIYDPPSDRSHSPPLVESKVEMSSSSQPQHQRPVQEPEVTVSPVSEPAVLHHDTGHGYSRPVEHPTSEDKGKAPERNPHYDSGYEYSQPSGHQVVKDDGKAPEPAPQQHVTGYGHSDFKNHATFDERAKHPQPPAGIEDRPDLPGPRPPVEPEVADYYAQTHAANPAIQEQEDRDYAMALALQEEEESQRPPLPQRPSKGSSEWAHGGPQPSHPLSPEEEDRALAMKLQQEEENGGPAPPLPTRPHPEAVAAMLAQQQQQFEPPPFTRTPSTEGFMAPPKRQGSDFGADDPNNPVHYARDPHKLIAYLVPFPKPWLGARAPTDAIPTRFLVYTPPPPPLQAPPEGVKEGVAHKVQRKWQAEVRQAKQNEAKTTSWAGFKAKCTRGVDKAMQYTTTSNLDFLARVTPPPSASSSSNLARRLSLKGKGKKGKTADEDVKGKDSVDVDEKAEDGKGKEPEVSAADEKAREVGVEEKAREENPFEEKFSEEKVRDEKGPEADIKEKEEHEDAQDDDPAHQAHETKKTVGVEEIVFVYPPNMNMTPEAMREEFINTMLRTKSKAQRDAIIATGLLPVSLAIDLVMIAVSGLFEVNAVWAYFTIKGTKTARSVTKRIASTSKKPETIDPEKPEQEMDKEDKLRLSFRPATRIDVLSRYLQAECHRVDSRLFPRYTSAPTEIDCLEAIGWSPARTGGQKNWEDEAWEVNDVKEDLRVVMHKAAKEWRKWCNRYEKNPEKSMNK
ncbi:secreted protein [Colletotrichum plurivorum]|uniref:Secreted protein n=1 Tax=Colletotrichum plurivorum TaxID=2175906 RepID=A0A8H6KNT6_9PEZI|nr:secreted protein [Colletotrichum plurivorum]